ncbi:hypothetical protein [Fluviispira multicolorata]|uniref:Uncharacterized protein n=1 Tax=Fluviispira multicolorata TaxID=2654512 RepID=A0A833JCN6_9BACT|nr:hypothetical protein [Fluviispira multicolorata]KAB8030672.1 hypothetical protein GCL57_06770 [Fluviispira multicolorata]
MRLVLIFFIIIFFFVSEIYSQDIEYLTSEKDVFSDSEKSKVIQWKNLRKVDTNIEKILGNITSLALFSNTSDITGKSKFTKINEIGLGQNEIRVEMNLLKAQDHLHLGDPFVAKEIVLNELKNINTKNRTHLVWAYKILFEANRYLNKHNESIEVCLNMLSMYGENKDLFTDKWKLSCSLEFFKEAKREKKIEIERNFKEKLTAWSNSLIVKKDTFYMPLSAIFISQTIRYVYPNKILPIQYLENAITHSKSGNKNLARAYLALALLKYEIKNKDESLAVLRYLSGDFKGYGAHIKYFENNESSQQIARLCLARYQASVGNLNAAETWYRDVLLEKKISGNDFVKNEKKKAYWEYAQILYSQKKYLESAKQYKLSLKDIFYDHNFIINQKFDENSKKIRTSNIMLAKILSKTSQKNFEAEGQLLELLGYAEADLDFLNNLKNISKDNTDEIIQSLFALTSLSLEYGVDSKDSQMAMRFRNAISLTEDEISTIRTDLANALNAADYTYTGIIETKAISALMKLTPILDELKQILLILDQIESGIWDQGNVGLEFAKKNRFEILRRINAMDDEISNYRLKEKIEDKIYKPKLPGSFQLIGDNINELSSQIAATNFLFQANDKKIPKEIPLDILEFLESDFSSYERKKINDEFIKLTIDNRVFQLSRNLQTNTTFQFQIKEKVLEKSFVEMFELHKRNRKKSNSIGDIEFYKSLDNTWRSTVSVYNILNITIDNIKERIVSERKEILDRVDYIKQHLVNQENQFEKIKSMTYSEFQNITKDIVKQLIPRVISFKEYIKIELANHNKEIYNFKNFKNKEIEKSAEERVRWLNTLRDTSKWDLIR